MAKAYKRPRGIRGIDKVAKNLNIELRKIKLRSVVGLIQAAALIRSDMEKTPPLIPVDTGNLRASWFVTPGMVERNPFIVMGFSAAYALAVHETPKKYSRPGSGAKFFESALNRNQEKILNIIANDARIR